MKLVLSYTPPSPGGVGNGSWRLNTAAEGSSSKTNAQVVEDLVEVLGPTSVEEQHYVVDLSRLKPLSLRPKAEEISDPVDPANPPTPPEVAT
jgi:hypothetical protein